MHRWLLLLLIALLPLRAWVGDAMAGETIAGQVVAAQAQAAGFEKVPAGVQTVLPDAGLLPHHDCERHAQPGGAVDNVDVSAPTGISDCSTCASCQVCSSVALTWSMETGRLAVASIARPRSGSPQFASADAALDLRPPIS